MNRNPSCDGFRHMRELKIITMKKKLFYTAIFLFCGAFFFSSCEDMLNVESNRVEYEFDEWTANDSVFSVLGILKSVQEVGDRQVLLNELRADLITLSDAKAVVDVQEISRSVFNLESNPYLDVKDYYAIINNCNIYLARVDTSLTKNNVKLMMPEYVAVKSVRAWTYLQLAINYNNVPFFTEPILTHSAAENVMKQPMLSREEIMDKLIAELLPYENPSIYPMPAWDSDGKVLKFGYNNTEVETKKLFVPIRMLLGEMYLWKGDYKNAALCFYDQIAGSGTNNTAPKLRDDVNSVSFSNDKGTFVNDDFSRLFAAGNFSTNANEYLAMIPYANNTLYGTTSGLADVFSPQDDKGGAQVFASPGILSLAKQQMYRFVEGDVENPTKIVYGTSFEYPGDLRVKVTTYSQIGEDDAKTEFNNIIGKFNIEKAQGFGLNSTYVPKIPTTFIVLQRTSHAYLRFAEALIGMERMGYDGAMELAMTVLKSGVKRNYSLMLDPEYNERVMTLNGDTVWKYTFSPETGEKLDSVPSIEKYLASYADSIGFNFSYTEFSSNKGIHARGAGDADHNPYYGLTKDCMARYYGYMQNIQGVDTIIFPNPEQVDFAYADSVTYVTDLIIDELALELAWEGTRFGDLVRFAKATGDYDVLAKRIAGREFANDVTYRAADFKYDVSVYNFMLNEANWYLPLPAGVVAPVSPDEVPGGTLPEDEETPGNETEETPGNESEETPAE